MRSRLTLLIAILLSGLCLSGQQICFAYKSVIPYMGYFAAAGEAGKIDLYSPDGKLEKTVELPSASVINDVYVFRNCLAAAADGLLAVYDGENLDTIQLEGDAISLAVFRDRLIVGLNTTDGARIVCLDNFDTSPQVLPLDIKGSLTALSAGLQFCCGVTSEGEIIRTTDLENWTVLDFNAQYDGFYPRVCFSDIEIGLENLAVVGTTDVGAPAMFISSQGSVWSYRELSYSASQGSYYLEEEPFSVIYDYLGDQYVMLCGGGVLFSVPACAHCNKFRRINANELKSLAFTYQGDYFVVGSDDFSAVVPRN